MKPLQNIWLTIFNFVPAIILGVYKHWWLGIMALVATFILSWLLFFIISDKMTGKYFTTWSWIKPPMVATIVLTTGWYLI